MLILLWGLSGERPIEIVGEELTRLGLPWILLDQREVLATRVELSVGTEVRGVVRAPGYTIDLETVTAVYTRPYDSCRLPAVVQAGPASDLSRYARAVDDTLTAWTEVTPALVVNRIEPAATNDSKPYQLELIRRAGFRVPETLVTTDPEAARAFWALHGELIYKSVSSVRSQVARLCPEHSGRLDDIATCPTQFQRYIRGVDYRVHVVGTDVFACTIASDATDYRYAADLSVNLHACDLPRDVAARCVELAATIGLPVAGIDLRRCDDDEWYGFEVNPCPAFSYYEDATGLPIGAAIAALLARGD